MSIEDAGLNHEPPASPPDVPDHLDKLLAARAYAPKARSTPGARAAGRSLRVSRLLCTCPGGFVGAARTFAAALARVSLGARAVQARAGAASKSDAGTAPARRTGFAANEGSGARESLMSKSTMARHFDITRARDRRAMEMLRNAGVSFDC